MYPTIGRKVLSFFVCRQVNGVQYLAADFSLHWSLLGLMHFDRGIGYIPKDH